MVGTALSASAGHTPGGQTDPPWPGAASQAGSQLSARQEEAGSSAEVMLTVVDGLQPLALRPAVPPNTPYMCHVTLSARGAPTPRGAARWAWPEGAKPALSLCPAAWLCAPGGAPRPRFLRSRCALDSGSRWGVLGGVLTPRAGPRSPVGSSSPRCHFSGPCGVQLPDSSRSVRF